MSSSCYVTSPYSTTDITHCSMDSIKNHTVILIAVMLYTSSALNSIVAYNLMNALCAS
jgi:hypothetical protein